MEKTHYEALGVAPDASGEEIKAAYRRLAREYHPDKNSGKSRAQIQEAEQRIAEVNAAYEVLGTPETRAAYDAALSRMDGMEDVARLAETGVVYLARTRPGAAVGLFLEKHGVKDAPGLVGDAVRLLSRAVTRTKKG